MMQGSSRPKGRELPCIMAQPMAPLPRSPSACGCGADSFVVVLIASGSVPRASRPRQCPRGQPRDSADPLRHLMERSGSRRNHRFRLNSSLGLRMTPSSMEVIERFCCCAMSRRTCHKQGWHSVTRNRVKPGSFTAAMNAEAAETRVTRRRPDHGGSDPIRFR